MPVPIVVAHSVGYDIPSQMSYWPDHIIADHIKRVSYANIKFTKRLNSTQIIVEYNTPRQREKALRNYSYFMPNSLDGQVIFKQHFLERDVIGEIRYRIANASFMVMGPERHVLDALCAGRAPKVPKGWLQDTLPKLMFYVNPFLTHHPRVQLQIAHATLRNFGLVCEFVAKLSHTRDKDLQQEVKLFYRAVANTSKKHRKGFRRSLMKSAFDNSWFKKQREIN